MQSQTYKIYPRVNNNFCKVTIYYSNPVEKEIFIKQTQFFATNRLLQEISFTFSMISAAYLNAKFKENKNLQVLNTLNLLFLIKSFKKEVPFQQLFEKKNVSFFFNFFEIWEENKKETFNLFTPTIYNFYNTNVVNEHSPVMLECSLFLNKKSNFYNFYETKKL